MKRDQYTIGFKAFGLSEVISRCGFCNKVLKRSKTEKPKGRDARGKLTVDFCPEGTPCHRERTGK